MRTTCPHCERPIEIVVRRPAETAKSATPGGLFGRLLGANRYEFAARPVRARVRYDQAVEPTTSVTQPVPTTGFWDVVSRLLFSDEPDRATFRPPQLEDVLVPAIGSAITGAIVAAGSLFFVIPQHLPWTVVAGAGLAGVGLFWLASARRLLGRHGIVASIERIVQTDLDGDGVIGDAKAESPKPQTYRFRGQLDGGRTTIYTEFDITKPNEWHEFCQAITFHKKQFSGQEAARHKVPLEEFNRIKLQWASSDREKALVDPRSIGPQLTPQLTRMGRAMVRLFATTPPVADEV